MPTVIDALTVSLGLDPAAFVRGEKQAMTSFAKTNGNDGISGSFCTRRYRVR